MRDIEEEYSKDIEKEEEIFREGAKKNKSIAELEKRYSKKVKEIREIYEKSLKKELRGSKNIQKQKKDNPKKEVQDLNEREKNVEKDNIGKIRVKFESKIYKIGRKIKNFLYKITPTKIIYIYHKIGALVKNFNKNIKRILKHILNKFVGKLKLIGEFIKNIYFNMMSFLRTLFSKFNRKEKKGKKPKEEGEKNEDENKK